MQLADDVENLLDQNGGEAHGGFIQHQQLRMNHEAAAHGKHLLLTAGKRAGNLLAALLQTGKALIDVFQRLGDVILSGKGPHLQILLDGHLQEDAPSFGDVRHAVPHERVGIAVGDILVQKTDAAGFWMQQAGNRFQGGGFTRAVRTDQRDGFSLMDFKGNALDGMNGTVVDMDLINLQHGVRLLSFQDRLR